MRTKADIEKEIEDLEYAKRNQFNSEQLIIIDKLIKKGRTQILEKVKDAGLQDVIDFLDNLKNLRIDKQSSLNYEDGELPFGTCDYMAIDDMISKMKILSKIGDNSEVKE